jgi:hypothetical protein
MKTLQELIVAAKCRKGAAAGTTKKGAYWLACEPIKIRVYGGDGIGQSSPDCTNFLELRHFRDGSVQTVVEFASWHQNQGGRRESYVTVPALAMCETVEDVIVCLKSCGTEVAAYSDKMEDKLTDGLVAFGLPVSAPAPDEEPAEEPG